MLRNYLRIAFRNLRRNLGYTAINLTGLAIGIAACFLIALYVRHELSYDDFHAKAERIYRLAHHVEGDQPYASLHHAAPLGPALEQDFPEVQRAIRVSFKWGMTTLVTQGEHAFYEDHLYLVDSTFFEVFSFPLLRGDPATALTQPFSVVLTQRMADKYFPNENPIGQTIQAEGYGEMHELEVTGVAKNPPSTSHFQFNFLVSFSSLRPSMPSPENIDSWHRLTYYTYVLLSEEARPADLEGEISAFVLKRSESRADPARVKYPLQPITDIHLHSNYDYELSAGSDIRYVYIFGTLALLILVVACINYVNLATAQATRRAREVGVRKTIGARRPQLIRQFLGESALLCLMALTGALGLAYLALPLFNALTGLSLGRGVLDIRAALLFLGIGVVVTLASGSYPALYLSRFRPAQVIKGSVQAGPAGSRFRQGLVVFQFAVAVALIASTLLIYRQLGHMQSKELGFNQEQVVAIHARGGVQGQYDAFKNELLQEARISGVTASDALLPATKSTDAGALIPQGVDMEEWRKSGDGTIHMMSVDEDFAEVMEIPVIAGRGLAEATDSDEVKPVLINETAAQAFGWDDPIGKTFRCCLFPKPRVVGVVADFHFQPLREHVQPLVLTRNTYSASYVLARVQPGDLPGALDVLQKQWAKVSDTPFEYTFLDRRFDQVYRAERRMASAFQVFAGLAVFIACLGLLGLTAYAAERRTKEIGIRKALGATMANIVALLSKEFVLLVVLACAVGAPVAYWAMERWLQDFAYRIEVSPWLFAASSAVAVLIALATISYQAIRAARTDPADALRYE